LLDSGAFSDSPDERLTPESALGRQLAWERTASDRWGASVRADLLVSYDLLIDEVWIGGERLKRRWTRLEAERAVSETVAAARYLARQRPRLSPRQLVLACQGVDASQYEDCVVEVLKVARPDDVIGLGGWCILGRFTTWMPVFVETLRRILPRISAAGLTRVHIFGVLFEPALGALLYLADNYGLLVSTDSSAPVLACSRGDSKKAGVRAPSGYWRDNVAWWVSHLSRLRSSPWYRDPVGDFTGPRVSPVQG